MAHDFLTTLAVAFEIASALYTAGSFMGFAHRKSALCQQVAEAVVEATTEAVEEIVEEVVETIQEVDQELTEMILDGFARLDAASEAVAETVKEMVEEIAEEVAVFDVKAYVAANYGGIRGLKKIASGKVKGYSDMNIEALWGKLVECGLVELPSA